MIKIYDKTKIYNKCDKNRIKKITYKFRQQIFLRKITASDKNCDKNSAKSEENFFIAEQILLIKY